MILRSFVSMLLGLNLLATADSPAWAQAGAGGSTQARPVAPTATLQSVLRQIAGPLKIRVVVDEAIVGALVQVPRGNLTPDQQLRQVLAPYDAFYLKSADAAGAARLTTIWVYPRGAARDTAPVPMARWGSTAAIEGQLASAEPDRRLRAYEALFERQGKGAAATLERALADPSDEVRSGALAAALEAGVELPEAELQALLADPAPAVRLLVLDAVEARPGRESVVLAAVADPDPAVSSRARDMLDRLQGAMSRNPDDLQQQLLDSAAR